MRTGNPVLRASTFERDAVAGPTAGVMTLRGSAVKTLLATAILVASAAFVWLAPLPGVPTTTLAIGGLVVGLILGLVIAFNPRAAQVGTPLYAAAEGLVLGAVSASYEAQFPGIVLNAIGLTLGTLVALLGCYVTGLVRVTEKLRLGVVAATGGICLVYLVDLGFMLFGHRLPFIHEATPLGILFSLVVVGLAAFNLVLDFDFIAKGAERQAPKYLEWYAAFGLLVTLIWLYLELLRLLSKIQSRSLSRR